MFMLKFVTNYIELNHQLGFLLKVDDDSFLNLKALTKYSTVMTRYHRDYP